MKLYLQVKTPDGIVNRSFLDHMTVEDVKEFACRKMNGDHGNHKETCLMHGDTVLDDEKKIRQVLTGKDKYVLELKLIDEVIETL